MLHVPRSVTFLALGSECVLKLRNVGLCHNAPAALISIRNSVSAA